MNQTELDYKNISEHYVSDLEHYARMFVSIKAILKLGKSTELIKKDILGIVDREINRINQIYTELTVAGVEKHVEGFD